MARRRPSEIMKSVVRCERFAMLFAANPVPSLLVRTCDRAIMEVNPAAARCLGYDSAELVGHTCGHFALDVDAGCAERELRLRTKRGSVIDAVLSAEPVELDGVEHLIVVIQDVTVRKRTEAALRTSEARFRDLTEAIHDVFWVMDPATRAVLYVSPAYEVIWGRSCARLLESYEDWLVGVHPDDRERVLVAMSTRMSLGAYDEEYRIVRPDGTVRRIHDRMFVIRDEGGAPIRFVGRAEDITDRVALHDQLCQAQRLESLGMLAGGIAHDFNNVLAVVASCAGLLSEVIPPDSKHRDLVDDIDQAVTRATGLTRQLLAFSRRQVIEPIVLDLNTSVNETRRMLRRMVGEDIAITMSLEPELAHVRVDPGYLVQVIMNLAVNARDAMPQGGVLDLSTRNVEITPEHVRRHPGVKVGPGVMLAIKDTGCGMAPEVLPRVFEPLFTTKAVGRGTGMGLAVVRGIIDQAGGYVEIETALGRGTTFRIYLPATDGHLFTSTRSRRAITFGSETLLVVDDDEYVRRAAARGLRARGYAVLEASSGAHALTLLDAHPTVALLITDVVMPVMDGRELVEIASVRFPGLRVLFTSGYTDDAIVHHGVLQGQVEFLEKPFRPDVLATKVRNILDGEARGLHSTSSC